MCRGCVPVGQEEEDVDEESSDVDWIYVDAKNR